MGAATGIGSLPGTDIVEAVRTILGELPDLPYLPELPDRGPGADLVGRGAGLLVELPVEVYANRWRIASRPGHDLRVARDLMERDLDAVTEQAAGYTGTFKVQAAGPFTLAAAIELATGGPLLRDPGAVRDLVASLAEGLRGHLADLAARLPGARLLLQLDEPSLPAALAGRVPTESGFGTLRRVEESVARSALSEIIEAAGVPVVVHCCARDVPVDLVRRAGAAGVALDLGLVEDLDALGETLDAGLGLIAGAVDTRPQANGRTPSSAQVASRVRELWGRLGFPASRLPEQVVVAPACGLAGASPEYARAVIAACRDAGRRLAEE
ncbi:methionine synthase [Planosporangium thailandense]|uniref:Methionine synthase n=1 Tax=Planosporangium thailandense TaxID=765197 RepID=A0ABX0XRY1_9ACTN|nr:methionine synthase [Planosporangium thailandense]NJC68112.1 methionine synthase [Planosporangium thailandense]